MGKPCPNCWSREPIDMHSCRAEKVLRKQRQEWKVNWDDVEGGQHPSKVTKKVVHVPKMKLKAEVSLFLVSCGMCDLCLELRPEYCRALPMAE